MTPNLLIITPPFTQLNTPYPASAYLKGFLNTKNIASTQADLGIEVILKMFSRSGLTKMFDFVASKSDELSQNASRIQNLSQDYITTIDSVISFLQGSNPTLALQICQEDFLPEASRFNQVEDLDWAFGSMGVQDKAKHLATLYLEDLSDFIVECVDENFGFSRYAERLGRSASSFDELYEMLQQPPTYVDDLLFETLQKYFEEAQMLVLMSVPFPGNLYAAFRSAQWIKQHYPDVKIAMGGGFPNTELRSLSDVRVFEFFDFITIDDGERPVELLINYLSGDCTVDNLKRTFLLQNNVVTYINNPLLADYKQSEVGTPDYSDLLLDKYISVIEVVNPMHRMWSDGRWNKLTMAHGCYWGKCTFCDISLDYIKIYEPLAAALLCDRVEELIAQTGQTGFHFVDEAAPPALMRAFALEVLRRKITLTWWTNIRFEKSFTKDLCFLLKASGCIAVSGGLEVASDRLLKLIDKGVTVEQVAKVTRNFTEAGIMVHSYLMYGYPTQTIQETVDSLEMVRQMFKAGVLQSGFWHQFAMTAHSPVGMYPDQYGVIKQSEEIGTFANNDIFFKDKTGIDHEKFSFGLSKSLFNFMHGICFDYELQDWFDFKIPRTSIPHNFIENSLQDEHSYAIRPTAKVVWIGPSPIATLQIQSKKGRSREVLTLLFHTKKDEFKIQLLREEGEWLQSFLERISIRNTKMLTLGLAKKEFEESLSDFELFWFSKPLSKLKESGLLEL